eukprot:637468_1
MSTIALNSELSDEETDSDSTVDSISSVNIQYVRTSVDHDDNYLYAIGALVMHTWIVSISSLISAVRDPYSSHFANYNTQSVWIYFWFAVTILSITFIRLLYKLCLRHRYDARSIYRKAAFAIRLCLSVSIGSVLLSSYVQLGTSRTVIICGLLMVIDIIGFITDIYIHWELHGIPPFFSVFNIWCFKDMIKNDIYFYILIAGFPLLFEGIPSSHCVFF